MKSMTNTYRLLILATALLVTGCATTQDRKFVMAAKTSNVRIGPVHELLKVKTAGDKVQVVLDRSGLGHVIVALTDKKEVHHIVVGPEGILEREVIHSSISPWTIDAAFDAAGLLHVLIDDEHWIKKDDLWCNVERTPWKEAGLKVVAPRFVPGASDLIWAFEVEGKEFGTPKRWDLFGFASYGGVIIWPWKVSANNKLILVPETESTYTTWAILDPHEGLDVSNCQLVGVKDTVHILYDAMRVFLVESYYRRYAQFAFEDRFSEIASGASNTTDSNESKSLQSVTGRTLDVTKFGSTYTVGHEGKIATDPVTETALILRANLGSWLIRNNEFSERVQLPFVRAWCAQRLASAGNDRFHALVIAPDQSKIMTIKCGNIFYLEFAQGAWTAPVKLGVANGKYALGSVQLGSNGGREALAVWPTEEGIVARWIFLPK